MISVLAIELKVRGFKSGRERWILRPIKIRSTPSFGGEVKPSVPCRKIFASCQRTIRSMNKDTSLGQINHFIRQFLLLCNKVTVGRIARECWWKNRFSTVISFHHGSPCSYIIRGINNWPVGGRSSETKFHHIDMMMIIIIYCHGT
jgi:hypothetical protein